MTRLTAAEASAQALGPGALHRNRLLVTTLRLIRALRVGRKSVVDLADELGENKRTVYRMLNALEGSGIEVERSLEGSDALYRIRRGALEKAFGL